MPRYKATKIDIAPRGLIRYTVTITHQSVNPSKVDRVRVSGSRGEGKQRVATTWHSDSGTPPQTAMLKHTVATSIERKDLLQKAQEIVAVTTRQRCSTGKDEMEMTLFASDDSSFDGTLLTNGRLKCGDTFTWILFKAFHETPFSIPPALRSPSTQSQKVTDRIQNTTSILSIRLVTGHHKIAPADDAD